MRCFIVARDGYDGGAAVADGNKFLVGNGYIGYRGTLDEYKKDRCVGLNIAGEYDGVPGKWRETLNAFDPLYLSMQSGGKNCDAADGAISHRAELDLSSGIFSRRTVFDGGITLYTERFASMADKNLLCSRTVVSAENDADILLTVGVNTDIWELNGPHYKDVTDELKNDTITVVGVSQEKGRRVSVACRYSAPIEDYAGGLGHIRAHIKGGTSFVLDRAACVCVGETQTRGGSYDEYKAANIAVWQKLWERAAVTLDGASDDVRLALNYSIYHLLILSPKDEYSIAARGISGQTYKGAVFWDTEIFMLPFYLAEFPETAKKLVEYRINTLGEAKKKAAHYGYRGAFYAWESQDGYDACSDFNVVDVFTHRPVRTYFKDKQIHISADVAYAIAQYYERTGDVALMLNGGLETMLECAEFFLSYSYYNHNKNRYELLDVIGPDEYHERVNNNAYTNYMAHYAARQAVRFADELSVQYGTHVAAILEKTGISVAALCGWAEKLYLPQPNKDGVIEQFDGYFEHEDVPVRTVRDRLVNPNEYWGGSGGVATATRVIKQADVIMLFNLLPDMFDMRVQKANYDFYLPYTEHGSSLSKCAYALTACRIGEMSGAFDAFVDSASIDLNGGGKQWAGEVYIGGTHPASAGGAWMSVVLGFAGADFGGEFKCLPRLPKEIKSIKFKAVHKGRLYAVAVDANGVGRSEL